MVYGRPQHNRRQNGYFKLTRSCKIKAVILYIDGSKEIIEKSMRVK